MKLCFLVVDSIEDELEIWDFREVWVEVWEKADIEDMRTICIRLFIDGLDLLQQTILLYFLVIEEVLEEMLIVKLQEGSKVEFVGVVHFLVIVVDVETFIQESFVLEMHGEEFVLFLQEIDYLIVIWLVVLGVLVKLRNKVVESLLGIVDLIDLKYSYFGLVDHIMWS